MPTLTEIFSHVCGQGHGFAAGGAPLPVCCRCFGLYAGAAATAAWMLASGVWRRGLPSWSVFAANVAVLLAAMLGGLRVFGASPAWKLTFGLWTGHVAMLWLVGGAFHLRTLSGARRIQLPWRLSDKLTGLALPAALLALARLVGPALELGWHFWSAVVICGAAALLAAVVAATLSACVYFAGSSFLASKAGSRT